MTVARRFLISKALLVAVVISGLPICPVFAQTVAELEQLAEAGDANAQTALAWRLQTGDGAVMDLAKARQWYRAAAVQNHIEAQANLAMLLYSGKGGPVDNVEALRWLRPAAEAGHALAQHNLGVMHLTGAAGKVQHDVAARWFLQAAQAGIVNAQIQIAELLLNGQGIRKDTTEAFAWLIVADQSNEAVAHERRMAVERDLSPDQIVAGERRATELGL